MIHTSPKMSVHTQLLPGTQQQLCVVCMFATLLKKFENTYLYYLNEFKTCYQCKTKVKWLGRLFCRYFDFVLNFYYMLERIKFLIFST